MSFTRMQNYFSAKLNLNFCHFNNFQDKAVRMVTPAPLCPLRLQSLRDIKNHNAKNLPHCLQPLVVVSPNCLYQPLAYQTNERDRGGSVASICPGQRHVVAAHTTIDRHCQSAR